MCKSLILFPHILTVRLTRHLQNHSSAAVVLHPHKAGVASVIGHHHVPQQERGIALKQLLWKQLGAVFEPRGLFLQLVVSIGKPVHAAFGVSQLPEHGHIGQVEGAVMAKRAVEHSVHAMQGYQRLLRDLHFH